MMEDSQAAMRDGSILNITQELHDVVIQAWSVLQFQVFQGEFCWK